MIWQEDIKHKIMVIWRSIIHKERPKMRKKRGKGE
jgi:hypothetical protein